MSLLEQWSLAILLIVAFVAVWYGTAYLLKRWTEWIWEGYVPAMDREDLFEDGFYVVTPLILIITLPISLPALLIGSGVRLTLEWLERRHNRALDQESRAQAITS